MKLHLILIDTVLGLEINYIVFNHINVQCRKHHRCQSARPAHMALSYLYVGIIAWLVFSRTALFQSAANHFLNIKPATENKPTGSLLQGFTVFFDHIIAFVYKFSTQDRMLRLGSRNAARPPRVNMSHNQIFKFFSTDC